jgi:hypothetical protein
LGREEGEGIGRALVDEAEELGGGGAAGGFDGGVDGSEGGREVAGGEYVIKADNGNILRDTTAGAAQGGDGPHRRGVVAGKDGIQRQFFV